MTNGRQVVRYENDVLEVPGRDDAYTPLGLPPVVVLGLTVFLAGAAVIILALSVFLLAMIGLALAVFIFRFGRRPKTQAELHARRSAGRILLGPRQPTRRPKKTGAAARESGRTVAEATDQKAWLKLSNEPMENDCKQSACRAMPT